MLLLEYAVPYILTIHYYLKGMIYRKTGMQSISAEGTKWGNDILPHKPKKCATQTLKITHIQIIDVKNSAIF